VDFYFAYLERAVIRLIVGLPFFGKVGARVLLMHAEVRL
jgi:hypothetical protein